MWQDFKPTILFLIKFFGVYLVLSWLYGVYISDYDQSEPAILDPFTRVVAGHCTRSAEVFGYQTQTVQDDHLRLETLPEQTYDSIWFDGIYAISIEEGCNGLNIMILFLAFVIAFGGKLLNMLIFIPAGIIFIHLANIGRLLLLSLLNVEFGGRAFHFFHKYGFTAFIYLAVLLLWYLWVTKLNGKTSYRKKPGKREAERS